MADFPNEQHSRRCGRTARCDPSIHPVYCNTITKEQFWAFHREVTLILEESYQ